MTRSTAEDGGALIDSIREMETQMSEMRTQLYGTSSPVLSLSDLSAARARVIERHDRLAAEPGWGLTPLLLSAQLLVVELQELRHAGAPPSTELPSPVSSSSGPAPAQVDELLMRLNTHLEQVSSSIPALQQRLSRLTESPTGLEMMDDVQERWEEAQLEWEDVVRDVELLKEELKEDRWLVVFR